LILRNPNAAFGASNQRYFLRVFLFINLPFFGDARPSHFAKHSPDVNRHLYLLAVTDGDNRH
jgi:hypothetical protein